jgi:hypothetical protein
LPKGYVAWRLTGDAELLGDGKIELVWENKIDKLDIGKSVDLPMPCLKPAEVDRAWGQIVLTKSETIDLREEGEPKGLQPIDPQQDVSEKVEGAARAFSFHDDWDLTVVATRYKLEDVKRTSIERGVVRMVVTPAGEISVQAFYRIRTARDRLQVQFPAKVKFDTEPLRINGRTVMLETQKDDYFIPIVAPNADAPFLLEMRYTLPGGDGRLDLPDFPQDPAVQKIFLAVYLPETKSLLGANGPWTQEFRWRMTPALMWHAESECGSMLDTVQNGVQLSGNAIDNFQTDGRLYVYSTLRPEPAPAGSLSMLVFDNRWLQAIVFFAVFLGGAALVPARCGAKALAAGSLIAAIILLGVFCPTFAMQILNGILLLAIFLVAMLWGVAGIYRMQKCLPAKPPVQNAVPPTRDSGVDLSQYQPHAAEPKSGGNAEGTEGGVCHD